MFVFKVVLREMQTDARCSHFVTLRKNSFDIAARIALRKREDFVCSLNPVSLFCFEVVSVTFISKVED